MLLSKLQEMILQLGADKHYLIAFSGGMDSHVLLKLCVSLRDQHPITLSVIHIHHGINPQADHWALHCEQVCRSLNIPLTIHRLSFVRERGDSLEEKARIERYAAIAAIMTSKTILLTAHHQDDQAETFLLQLMRGSGLKGLSAMPVVKPFAAGLHARPLLSIPRAELLGYAKTEKLDWIEDDSNRNESLSRNYVRQQVMPLLNARWPAASAMIARSALHCAEMESLLNVSIQQSESSVIGTKPDTLSIQKLKQLSVLEQKHLLRAWIERQGYVLPSIKKLAAIMTTVFDAAPDKHPEVHFGQACIKRYQDDLYLRSYNSECYDLYELDWNLRESLALPGGRHLIVSQINSHGLRQSISKVLVRPRQGGEMVYLTNRGHRSLKKMFNEWKVLPWERAHVPLIFIDNQLIAVPGYYYHPEWVVGEAEVGLQVAFV